MLNLYQRLGVVKKKCADEKISLQREAVDISIKRWFEVRLARAEILWRCWFSWLLRVSIPLFQEKQDIL